MPECMLGRRDGSICSTCRNHLRRLEDEEDQRLADMNEEERQQMINFNDNYDESSNLDTLPSLLKMSSTVLNSSETFTQTPSSYNSTTDLPSDESIPIISDIETASSQMYRLNYLFSNTYPNNLTSFDPSPRFNCNALCRRDEIESHWLIHFHVDCILNTALIQQCPKARYGCKFQYERLEPCRSSGQSIQLCFDRANDAISFNWYPMIEKAENYTLNLLDFPIELLEKILSNLDSLSLRNLSCVCRRLRTFCEQLLPSRGIVIAEYERHTLSHDETTWIERKKHWLFTNTASAVPKWRLTVPNKLTSLNQHMITCPYGEKKDLENEPPFKLIGWTNRGVPEKSDDEK
ncbi:hypothetical protein I4U23_024961 [Adineta vaga]|nr:hypothetical protein I4U23_024961 [Adineta vaga]